MTSGGIEGKVKGKISEDPLHLEFTVTKVTTIKREDPEDLVETEYGLEIDHKSEGGMKCTNYAVDCTFSGTDIKPGTREAVLFLMRNSLLRSREEHLKVSYDVIYKEVKEVTNTFLRESREEAQKIKEELELD